MAEGQSPVGYDDTPFIPDSEWRVHDANRPQPAVITAGTNVVGDAPSDATVLFDGSDFSQWTGRDGEVQRGRSPFARGTGCPPYPLKGGWVGGKRNHETRVDLPIVRVARCVA